MDKSSSVEIPLDEQRRAWNTWNAAARETRLSPSSLRQAEVLDRWLSGIGRRDLAIIDIGCGAGWTCERVAHYGQVTGVDLADEVLERARHRLPHVRFLSGDVFSLELVPASFDLVITLEVLSHVKDQQAFVDRLASLLKPGGRLMLSTQNRPILERWSAVGAPIEGQIRHWVDARELRRLLSARFEQVHVISSMPVGDQGFLRIVNSPKLNALLAWLLPQAWIERAKERAMLGHTLMAMASRPVS